MKWQFDGSHTMVEAAAKHMMLSTVRVRFPGATGEVDLDPRRPEAAAVRLEIPVAGLASGDEKRDAHLRSADFFDAAAHPTITYQSRSIERTGAGAYRVSGDLTIRGTTRPADVSVTLQGPIDDPMGKDRQRAFVDASAKIDRRDWGLVWNMPVPQGVLVSNEIALDISAELVSEALAAAA